MTLFLVSLRDAYASHSLAETTFVFEFVRQRFELAEEQKVSLLDKHNSHIGNCFRRSSLGNFHKKICIGVLFSNASHCSHLFRVHFPLSVVVSGKIVLKIFQKLLQTGFSNANQPDFRFCRSGACCASFHNVLLAAASGLYHLVANAGIGQLASLFWAVDTGRLLQAPGLFILGMILARGDYFSRGAGFWVKTFVGSFIASFLFYVAKTSAADALQIILTMWYNMAFTGMLVSMFVILYQNDVFGRMTDGLRFYGRMSLTNYISQSIIGSLIFFPYALGLASTLGIAWSFVVGLGVMSAQIWFCRRWLRTHRQGPLEAVWHRLTWLK